MLTPITIDYLIPHHEQFLKLLKKSINAKIEGILMYFINPDVKTSDELNIALDAFIATVNITKKDIKVEDFLKENHPSVLSEFTTDALIIL